MTESKQPRDHAPRGLTRYLEQHLRADATAGLTVAIMGVPQAMAYALIAGLPPVYGLYTAIITCAVAALMGSSNHLVTGPTNALCMVMLSLTAHLPEKYDIGLLEIILLLSFLTGVIQIVFGALRLGGVIRYISTSVVIGFTAGAGILIALNQLKNILGIDISGAHAERSYEVLFATARQVTETNPYALSIGVATAVIMILVGKISGRLPGGLIAIAVVGLCSYFLGLHTQGMDALRVEIVRDIEPIKGSLPAFHIPDLLLQPNYELTRELSTGALALAILGLIEATSISRAVATSSGQRLNFTREFIGQGASKIVGSCFSCFAGSGSFTRTSVCFKSGGRTRMAAIFSAAWTTAALLLLGPVADYIPKAALAGLLVVIAYSMVDKHRLGLSWRSGGNARIVLASTLGATLILPLEWAIFVGVFLSLMHVLRTTGKTDLTQLVARPDVGYDEVPFNRAAESRVVTINMAGDLYFAAAEDLDYELLRCITPRTRVVVLRMKRLRAVGSTAMAMLQHFWGILRQRGIYLVVCGIEEELEAVLTRSGVRRNIGEENIFYADNKLFQSTELALARAWSIADMPRSSDTVADISAADHLQITAGDIMSTRFIRFGNQHQLREAVWLMSELLQHTKSVSPEPLFLQDREGKLFGELSPWRILRALTAGTDTSKDGERSDRALGELMRRDFTKSIDKIARLDLDRLGVDASLARLLDSSVQKDMQVTPVCDAEGRIKGLVSDDDLLRGLQQALVLADLHGAEPAEPLGATEPAKGTEAADAGEGAESDG
ncbi:MAG: SulP family inorganic anion transporter [Planctomycetota bacterium]